MKKLLVTFALLAMTAFTFAACTGGGEVVEEEAAPEEVVVEPEVVVEEEPVVEEPVADEEPVDDEGGEI